MSLHVRNKGMCLEEAGRDSNRDGVASEVNVMYMANCCVCFISKGKSDCNGVGEGGHIKQR